MKKLEMFLKLTRLILPQILTGMLINTSIDVISSGFWLIGLISLFLSLTLFVLCYFLVYNSIQIEKCEANLELLDEIKRKFSEK